VGGIRVALAGAAAVLSGLLFVAVSLNMAQILRIRTLPGRAGPLSMIAAIPAPDTDDRTGDLWTELQVRQFRTTARSCRAGRVP